MIEKPICYSMESELYGPEYNTILVWHPERRPVNASIPLFTESQLKAERERAIRECAEICSNIPHDNGITEPCFTNACESEILKLLDN
jgi:hypothetical protein